jgi:2-deoxy-D-gluconate 3-dehydrogenase
VNRFDLSGKTALVTGARTGIGKAIALAFAESGADIIGLGSSPMPETAGEIARLGRVFREVRCDLSGDPDFDALLDGAGLSKPVDIIVNNAGIIHRAEFLDVTPADWDKVMNINLRSAFFLTQAVVRRMIAAGVEGRIINIGSVLSFQGGIRVAAYTASKHAIVGVTRILANELAPHRITVNAIAPGYVATDNTAALRADSSRYEAIVGRIPAGRWGEPADIASAAIFLASPASHYVTGSVVTVDGGWLAR